MRDETNKTIIAMLILTICISLVGTFITLSRLSDMTRVPITGLATNDAGYARIHIEDLLALDIPDTNQTIDFGNCTPTAAPNTNVSLNSLMTEAQINATAMSCSYSNTPAAIMVQNTGNVNAKVNVTYSRNSTQLMVSSRAELYYRTRNATNDGGCAPADTQTDWTEVTLTTDEYLICQNLTYGEFTSWVFFDVNLTVPNDAKTQSSGAYGNTSVMTFQAFQVP